MQCRGGVWLCLDRFSTTIYVDGPRIPTPDHHAVFVVPVYKNQDNLPELFQELPERFSTQVAGGLEIVFVVDGSPDASLDILRDRLPSWPIQTPLVELSRNFGSFAAVAAGLRQGTGDYFAVVAADLQEPLELVLAFLKLMQSARLTWYSAIA